MKAGEPCGVWIVDKPVGPTSHDVVARARRALRTRRVGHAGTLDPMASGVLVVLVGEATKLAPYLTAHDKAYVARVTFGVATDSLDATGRVTARADVPPSLDVELERLSSGDEARAGGLLGAALEAERGRREQTPPLFSAIQVGGVRSYKVGRAARAADDVERSTQGGTPREGSLVDADAEAITDAPLTLAPRPTEVRALTVLGAERRAAHAVVLGSARAPHDLELVVHVGKGYYVRSLARDLGERVGVPAHLSGLRRVASGPFSLAEATPLDAIQDAAGLSLPAAARRALAISTLTESGAARARQGRALDAGDFVTSPAAELAAWLDPRGDLVALGGPSGDGFAVARGFATPPRS